MFMKFWKGLFLSPPPPLPRFWYIWQAHPFDDAQYFFIDAETKSIADRLAMERYTGMFDRGETIMIEFYPAKNPPAHLADRR